MSRKLKKSQSGSVALELAIAVVVIAAIVLVGWSVNRDHNKTAKKVSAANVSNLGVSSLPSAVTPATASPQTTPIATGDDNASLKSDLSNINEGLTQTSQDSTASNTAINDQQSEITVPTN